MSERVEIRVPRENVNDESVRLIRWRLPCRTPVKAGDIIAEMETSKTALSIPAPCDGFLSFALAEGSEIPVGAVFCVICDSADAEPLSQQDAAADSTANSGAEPAARFSSAARRVLDQVPGNADRFRGRGLVRAQDVLQAMGVSGISDEPMNPVGSVQEAPGVAAPSHAVELSRSKRIEIRHLRASLSGTLPSAVMTTLNLQETRESHEEQRLAFAARIMVAAGRLLREYPMLNGFCRGETAHLYDEVNIGYALDAGCGLKVPVIRAADVKEEQDVEKELEELLEAYLENRLPLESLVRATFTVTDLTGERVEDFLPLINERQSAMLGIALDGERSSSAPAQCRLILVFDHQMSTGREAAQFLDRLCTQVRRGAVETIPDASCGRCGRGLEEVAELGAMMLVERLAEGQSGHVCSLCLRGF